MSDEYKERAIKETVATIRRTIHAMDECANSLEKLETAHGITGAMDKAKEMRGAANIALDWINHLESNPPQETSSITNDQRLDYLIRHSCTQKADNGEDFWLPPVFPVIGKTFQQALDNEIKNETKE